MFLQGLSCVIVVAIALLAYRPVEAQDRVRLGLSSISATSGSIWVAEEKGLFKKQGVNVEVIFIGGGASRVVSALLSGEIQFSFERLCAAPTPS
jgi:ABC-type nitrate/sulfonate/bicarbonate transport system substrate-binding protein